MEGNVTERQGRKFKSRAHSKREKRKQRKAWLKRKRNCEVPMLEPPVEPQEESAHVADHTSPDKLKAKSKDDNHLSRGKKLVELPRKRIGQQLKEPLLAKISKRPSKHTSNEKSALVRKETEKSHLKEINRDLLSIDNSKSTGSGTFGNCYSVLYRDQFSVVVKENKMKDESCKETERARKEVLHEAAIIADIGDHPGIPYLFGSCTDRVRYYLVLQCHFMEGCSITLSKAMSTRVITRSKEFVEILKKTCEALQNIHDKGYLHNDLKGNNVVLDGQRDKPVKIMAAQAEIFTGNTVKVMWGILGVIEARILFLDSKYQLFLGSV